jgi:chloramphenicol-sensitive protein RarD
MEPQSHHRQGLVMALAAYTIWGLLPLYLQLVKHVPPFELVGWRILFTLPLCLIIVALRRQGGELRRALATRRVILSLLLSSLLIGANWLIFLVAIAEDHVLATSLGYYINPLVTVFLGTALLGEQLSRRQWLSVAIAGAGILLLLGGALDTLAISLSLALSFAFYGLVRKRAEVGAVPGLTIETAVLAPGAVVLAAWYAAQPGGTIMATGWPTVLAIAGSGVVTAVPLLMFAVAARRLDFATLGFIQFLSPTITFIVTLTLLDEPLDPLRLACFIMIWAAIALFSYDLWQRRKGA